MNHEATYGRPLRPGDICRLVNGDIVRIATQAEVAREFLKDHGRPAQFSSSHPIASIYKEKDAYERIIWLALTAEGKANKVGFSPWDLAERLSFGGLITFRRENAS